MKETRDLFVSKQIFWGKEKFPHPKNSVANRGEKVFRKGTGYIYEVLKKKAKHRKSAKHFPPWLSSG